MDLGEEPGHPAGGDLEARGVEDLRADVRVQADQVQVLGGEDAADRLRGGAGAEREAELLVVVRGGDELVGVRLHSGGDADQDLGAGAELGCHGLQAVDLVQGVQDDPADPGLHRAAEFADGLVVAVHGDAVGGDSGGQGHCQFTAGAHVELEPLLDHPAGDGLGQQGLARVVDVRVGEGGGVVPGAGTEVLLVHDEERSAVFGGEGAYADAADGDLAVRPARGGGPDLRVQRVEVLWRQRRVVLRQDLRVAGSGRVGVAAHGGLSAGTLYVWLCCVDRAAAGAAGNRAARHRFGPWRWAHPPHSPSRACSAGTRPARSEHWCRARSTDGQRRGVYSLVGADTPSRKRPVLRTPATAAGNAGSRAARIGSGPAPSTAVELVRHSS